MTEGPREAPVGSSTDPAEPPPTSHLSFLGQDKPTQCPPPMSVTWEFARKAEQHDGANWLLGRAGRRESRWGGRACVPHWGCCFVIL